MENEIWGKIEWYLGKFSIEKRNTPRKKGGQKSFALIAPQRKRLKPPKKTRESGPIDGYYRPELVPEHKPIDNFEWAGTPRRPEMKPFGYNFFDKKKGKEIQVELPAEKPQKIELDCRPESVVIFNTPECTVIMSKREAKEVLNGF
jgi:hypothetical protein